ncbi:MAG: ATP-binding protein, partial [Promethearchaeota archaeon]
MKKITVVSGKGGVGKTTFVAALAYLFHQDHFKIVVTDCDVDAPNLAVVLKNQIKTQNDVISANIAIVDENQCTSCRNCLENCKFSAIKWDETENKPSFDELICEGCGVCLLVCPVKCIRLIPIKTGDLIISNTVYGFPIVSGELKIGRGNSGKIVSEAKMSALKIAEQNDSNIVLNDGPPGIGCPVIASLSNSDYVIIITEPMPAAIHDLKRVLSLALNFTREIGIVINKFNLNQSLVTELENFCMAHKLKMLGKIPVDTM